VERDGACRVAKRLQAAILNAEGRTSGELAVVPKSPSSRISEWLAQYQAHGIDGLSEGYRLWTRLRKIAQIIVSSSWEGSNPAFPRAKPTS
jgi:hypothetical protein